MARTDKEVFTTFSVHRLVHLNVIIPNDGPVYEAMDWIKACFHSKRFVELSKPVPRLHQVEIPKNDRAALHHLVSDGCSVGFEVFDLSIHVMGNIKGRCRYFP